MSRSRYGIEATAITPGTSQFWLHSMAFQASSVLDVGCASGGLGLALAAEGKDVLGVDFDKSAVAEANERGLSAVVLDLEIEHLVDAVKGRKFDCIIFGDVLEHITDPARVLAEARDLLTPEGYILISIPNVSHASVRLSLLVNLLDRTHLRFFTLEALYDLAASAGYLVTHTERTYSDVRDPAQAPVSAIRDPGKFPEWLVHAAQYGPEAETLQFIVRLEPLDRELSGVLELRRAVLQARIELRDALRRQQVMEHELKRLSSNESRALAALSENLQLRDSVIGLRAQLGSLEYRSANEVALVQRELRSVLHSLSWRAGRLVTAPARLVRKILRGAVR